MKQIMKKFSKGAVLAYSLILLGIVLIISVGMITSSTRNLRSTLSSNKSAQSFQIADSGSQSIIAKINVADSGDKLSDLGSCSNSGSYAKISEPVLGGSYTISFYRKGAGGADELLSDCNDPVSDITSIKSTGEYGGTRRAVQVAVAAGTGAGITGGCVIDNSNIVKQKWGEGCKANNSLVGTTCSSVATSTDYECGPSGAPDSFIYCLCVKP